MTNQITINKDDLQDLIVFAERYTIGRATFAPLTFKNICLKHLSDLKTGTIKVIIADIEREQERDYGLGEEYDKQMWLGLLETLKSEIAKSEPTTRMATLSIPHYNS